jgi:hypothetical protein
MVIAEEDLATVLRVAAALGIGINTSKTQGPATKVKILGVQVDTVTMTVSLTAEKLCSNIFHAALICELAGIKGAALPARLLHQLAGRFQHMTATTTGGHHHVSGFWAAATEADAEKYGGWLPVRFIKQLYIQARWWKERAQLSMPIRRHIHVMQQCHSAATQSDASGTIGFAASKEDEIIWGRWNDDWQGDGTTPGTGSSTAKELYGLMSGILRFARDQTGTVIMHKTDNVGVCFALTKGSSKSTLVHAMISWTVDFLEQRNIELLPWFVPREFNTICDAAAGSETLEEARKNVEAAASSIPAHNTVMSLRRFKVEHAPAFDWDGLRFTEHTESQTGIQEQRAYRHPIAKESATRINPDGNR